MRSARVVPMIVAVALMSLASCDDDDGTSDSTQATTEAPAPTTTASGLPRRLRPNWRGSALSVTICASG